MHGESPYHQGQLDFFCAVYSVINALRLTYGIDLAQSRRIFGTALLELSSQSALWRAVLSNHTGHHWVVRYMLGRFCRAGRFALRAFFPDLEPAPVRPRIPDSVDLTTLQLDESGNDTRSFFGQRAVTPRMPASVILPPPNDDSLTLPAAESMPLLESCAIPNAAQTRSHLDDDSVWPLLREWLPRKPTFSFGLLADKRKTHRCALVRFHRYLPPAETPLISHWSTGFMFNGETLQLADCTASKNAVHELPSASCVFSPQRVSSERVIVFEKNALVLLERPE